MSVRNKAMAGAWVTWFVFTISFINEGRSQDCVDVPAHRSSCAGWLGQGYCKPSSTHFAFMKINCGKTCNFCQVSGGCNVKVNDRIDCGWPGIPQKVCENRGCCFNPKLNQATNQCFLKAGAKKVEEQKDAPRVDIYNDAEIPRNILKDLRSKFIMDNSSTYANAPRRKAVLHHRCNQITGVPRNLRHITKYNFYRKYTHAYGIPVVSSGRVSNQALTVACYIVRILFADRADTRDYFYSWNGRVAVIGAREQTTTIPEFSNLPNWWNTRARGLGGMLTNPISTGGEENLLCWSTDRYIGQDIFLHETSHSVAEVSIKAGAIPGFYPRLQRHYNWCRYTSGVWRGTYAMSTVRELFAHGTQSYFDANYYSNPPNGIHNEVNTRAKLRVYDPILYRMLKEVYPCRNKYYWCYDWKKRGPPPDPKMDCDSNGTPNKPTKPRPTNKPEEKGDCKDIRSQKECEGWKTLYCNNPQHKKFMRDNCKKTCGFCTGGGGGGAAVCKKKTTTNVCCKLPFIYNGKSYSDCTKVDYTKEWCSTTSNYDKDKKWGICKDCKDIRSQKECEGWKTLYCNHPQQKKFMRDNCKKTCGFCTGGGGGGGGNCKDKDKNCASWAGANYCGNSFVKNNCKKSCKTC